MKQVCLYDSSTDLEAVRPSLSVDLSDAVENGVLPDNGSIPEYNDIADPNMICGRVRDSFEAIDAQKAILKAGKVVTSPDPTPAPPVPASDPTSTPTGA